MKTILFKGFSILTFAILILGASVSFAEDERAVENENAVTEANFSGNTDCKDCPLYMTGTPVPERSQYHSSQLADQTLGTPESIGKGGESEAER